MKCKPYSEITVEIRTQLKTVKITSNIFAVQPKSHFMFHKSVILRNFYIMTLLQTIQMKLILLCVRAYFGHGYGL